MNAVDTRPDRTAVEFTPEIHTEFLRQTIARSFPEEHDDLRAQITLSADRLTLNLPDTSPGAPSTLHIFTTDSGATIVQLGTEPTDDSAPIDLGHTPTAAAQALAVWDRAL